MTYLEPGRDLPFGSYDEMTTDAVGNGETMVKRSFNRRRLTTLTCLVGVVVVALVLLFWLRQRPGVEERLRAIDAAHVIPDEENAARDYSKLIMRYVASSLAPKRLPEQVRALTRSVPWRSADYPEAGRWLADHREVIDALLAAGRKPRCWFSVSETRWLAENQPLMPHNWGGLLLQSANNDLGEGRTEAGLEKLLCLLHVADHFLAQDQAWRYRLGMDLSTDGLSLYARLVVEQNVPQDWLKKLEAALPPTRDTWAQKAKQLDELADLYERGFYRNVLQRLSHTLRAARPSGAMRVLYLEHLSRCRAVRVLAALRRHKDRTGTWPTRLAEVEPYLSPEMVIDPFSGKPFRYGIKDDTFFLYGVGPNGTDEGGNPPSDLFFGP